MKVRIEGRRQHDRFDRRACATDAVPGGTWVSFAYDSDQNLDLVSYADGSGIDYEYDDANDVHNLTAKRNAGGHLKASWAYDGQDRCLARFNPIGKGFGIVYQTQSQVEVTDAYGSVRTYTIGVFDGSKRLEAMQGPALAPYSAENGLRWEYDAQLNLIEVEYGGGTINRYRNQFLQIGVLLADNRFVPILKKMPVAFVPPIETHRIPGKQSSHQARQGHRPCAEKKMSVIWHQDPRADLVCQFILLPASPFTVRP